MYSHTFKLPSIPIIVTIYYFCLFLVPSTLFFFALSFCLFILLYLKSNNIIKASFYSLLVVLPFAKGKTLNITMLKSEQIIQNPLFDVTYSFPIYVSDFFLLLSYILIIRKQVYNKQRIELEHNLLVPLGFLTVYVIICSIPILYSDFPEVIFLSVIQLIKLLLIFALPSLIKNSIKKLHSVYQIVSLSVIFQSVWAILQFIKKSPLYLGMEVYLPKSYQGIFAVENHEIFRSTGTFYEPSILGTFLIVNLTLFFSLKTTKISNNMVKMFLIVISSIAITMTASRGIYLVSILTLFLIYFYKKKLKINIEQIAKKVKYHLPIKKNLIFILSLLVVLYLITPYLKIRLGSIKSLFSYYGSGTYRLQIAYYALRLSEKKLFGIGLNLSPYFFATSFIGEKFIFDAAHPHNIFFQILAENGVVGFLIFSIFLYTVYRPSIKKRELNNFCFASIIFLMCAQLYPIYINHPEILSYFFLYLGFSTSQQKT